MSPIDIDELKNRITVDMVIQLMEYYGADVQSENEEYIIYQSICHHSDSYKLYFYKESISFYCWSSCSGMDIISLVQNIEGVSCQEAIEFLEKFFNLTKKKFGREKVFHKPREVKQKVIDINEKLLMYNSSILNTFVNTHHASWLNEGISDDTMDLFGIKYDINTDSIIIPHYDLEGRLIGIRCRNLDKNIIENYAKYSPYMDKISGIMYSHPLGKNLYGLNINKDNIMKHEKCILVESEKSVLKIQDYYPNDNISLALCGSNVTPFQLELLKSIGVKQVIYALDKEEEEKILKKMDKIYKKTAIYFDTYVVTDTEGLLDLKDSPTDRGKDVFDELLINKKEYKLNN